MTSTIQTHKEIIDQMFQNLDGIANKLKEFLQNAFQDQVGLVNSRTIFQDLIDIFPQKLSLISTEVAEDILQFALTLLQSRTVAFEEQVFNIDLDFKHQSSSC
jgi:DNA topoisomerase VI subunit B